MSPVAAKHRKTVDEAIEHLISRADNARSLTGNDVSERVVASLEKYLLSASPNAANADIKAFIDGIRADDLCLILACERGDEDAWAELVENFGSTVRSAAGRITSNAEDAEDLAGSIWAELYGLRTDADGKKKSKLSYYSGRGSLGGWLRAVVAQLAIDQHRKISRFVQLEEDRELDNAAADASGRPDAELVSRSADPEALLTEKEASTDLKEALSEAIAGLEAEDRLILKLYYFDDLRLKDIAEMFSYHEATASRRLARLQADIRKSVEKELRGRHGWSDQEVKRHLQETAAGLGLDLETMLAIALVLVAVQDLWF